MKIISVLAVAQLFLLVAGSDEPEEPKRVGCYYIGKDIDANVTVYPEDIDASLCSNLVLVQGFINNETGEVKIEPGHYTWKNHDEDFVTRLVKLKAVNPDLKVTLLVGPPNMEPFIESYRSTNVIKNVVKWLNESGFDGLDFPFFIGPDYKDKMADLLCDMKSEFDKHGYMLTAILADHLYPDPLPGQEDTISKLARCCEYVSLLLNLDMNGTNYFSPVKRIKSNVDWFLERGLPANKMKILVPSIGIYVRLKDPKETGIGAKVSGPANDPRSDNMGILIGYKEILRQLNDSSLGWTIHRDENTKDVYAFNKKGLWATYEDPESISFKARYVMEKGLRGMVIAPIDMDDYEGIEGEGKNPLTRAVYNTFRRQNQPEDAIP